MQIMAQKSVKELYDFVACKERTAWAESRKFSGKPLTAFHQIRSAKCLRQDQFWV